MFLALIIFSKLYINIEPYLYANPPVYKKEVHDVWSLCGCVCVHICILVWILAWCSQRGFQKKTSCCSNSECSACCSMTSWPWLPKQTVNVWKLVGMTQWHQLLKQDELFELIDWHRWCQCHVIKQSLHFYLFEYLNTNMHVCSKP